MSVAIHLGELDTSEEYVEPRWWTVPLVVLSVLPIAWRRVRPVESAAVIVAAQVISTFADIGGAGFIGVLIALYSLGAHSVGRRRTRLLIATVLAIATLFIAGFIVDELELGDFISSVVILVTAFVLGDNLRRRRDTAKTLEERLVRAERERELVAEQKVHAERTRIARELHDVVAHSVSVMVIQAAAARRNLATSPHNAEIALTNVESTGRQTMEELRAILGVLRDSPGNTLEQQEFDAAGQPAVPEPTRRPQPRLSEIPALVEASGDLPINLSMSGDLAGVSSSIDLTGFRVVQESLTNIRRHAGPVSLVDVTIECKHEEVMIRILDDGRGAAADRNGPGYGLVGMQERVDAVGGHLAAGWRVGGGWSVTATLPTALHRRPASEARESVS